MQPTSKKCKDCPSDKRRKAPHPGPRCRTHHRETLATRRRAAQIKRVSRIYGISEYEYRRIYEAQGRCCYICQRAKGTGRKRLSVDHDHSCCPGPTSCGKCVRGLLCLKCNRDVLGHLRDDPDALRRAVEYLTNPPAKRVLVKEAA